MTVVTLQQGCASAAMAGWLNPHLQGWLVACAVVPAP